MTEPAPSDEVLPAAGSSMFPFVPAGSLLHLRPADSDVIHPGDVVCYPAAGGVVVAHRVLRVEGAGEAAMLVVRGDNLGPEERIPVSAAAYVVTRVRHRLFDYTTGGPMGRVVARLVTAHPRLHRAVRRFSLGANSVRRALPWRV